MSSTTSLASPASDYSRRDSNKGTGLKKCFTALVDRKQVCLDLDVLVLMLKKELLIKMDDLDPDLISILPYMLIYYIKSWPGWNKSSDYFSGKIQFKAWYEKFHKYIVLKLSHLIREGYKDSVAELDEVHNQEIKTAFQTGKLFNRGSQTDNLAPKGFSPFTIDITVSASAASTVVFTDNNKGDVILKHHNELEWGPAVEKSITLNQLIHWPNVEVTFTCPFFEFTRKNKHTYNRQIGLVSVPYVHENIEYIQAMDLIDKNLPRKCYTLDLMKQLSDDLVETLRLVLTDNGKLEETITVIDEFLSDVLELGVKRGELDTMATNTSVLFNIGRSSYFRNKKLSKGPNRLLFQQNIVKTEKTLKIINKEYECVKDKDMVMCWAPECKHYNQRETCMFFKFPTDLRERMKWKKLVRLPSRTDINFVETMIPKAEIALIKFEHEKTADDYLNILKNLHTSTPHRLNDFLPKITYFCNFCNVEFMDATNLLTHLRNIHKMEQRVLCSLCKKSFAIVDLAKDRWKHACTKKQEVGRQKNPGSRFFSSSVL